MKQEDKSQQTKLRFAEALKAQLRQKPLTKITVSELVTACGLNRKTFYYHFTDIYDLLRWMLERETMEAVRQYDLLVEYEEAILYVLDYIEKNEPILQNICHNGGREQLKDFFFANFVGIYRQVIEQVAERNHLSLSPEFLLLQSHFYAEAVAGLMLEWIEKQIVMERKQAVLYINAILRASIPATLESMGSNGAFPDSPGLEFDNSMGIR
ncbi:MAG: TetR/AcrR family transcriptional regulator [Clostridiales bacterium]|nr:TetR/AcrR family transcriptional regulator [Clostridiales bacterium]